MSHILPLPQKERRTRRITWPRSIAETPCDVAAWQPARPVASLLGNGVIPALTGDSARGTMKRGWRT